MSYQLYQLHTPSTQPIPGGLHEGKQIVIRGRMYEGGDSFYINLQNEYHEDSKIAFHFNPRHSERMVVRNSFDGAWESEERDEVYYYPFGEHDEFLLRILVTDSEYQVYANGIHMLDFGHRHSFHDVNYIKLSGDCQFYDISYQDKVRSPYIGRIPGNFQVGKGVRIRGAVTDDNQEGFVFNFQCDDAGDMIAYHFNPRPEIEDVVRNSKIGDWGEEERGVPHFPFHPGSFFDLFCIATEEGFATFVNNEHFTTFPNRCNIHDVSHVCINGGLEIADFQFFDQTKEHICQDIPSGLKKGDTILVRGVFEPHGETFSVNLRHEADSDSDVGFHFNPRRSEDCVVINSCYGGEWGDEVRESLPWIFKESMPFDLRLVAKRKKIKVFCNGRYISKFEVRNPILDIVKAVTVDGDAFIHQIRLQREVLIPFTERLPGHISNTEWIRFTGTIKKDSTNFSVNLACGPGEDDDLAFHFNVRINDGVVIRNSKQGGEWQNEEDYQDEFPFQNADFFEIILFVKPHIIQTYVNGQKYISFEHRVPYESITDVKVFGDANFFEPEFI